MAAPKKGRRWIGLAAALLAFVLLLTVYYVLTRKGTRDTGEPSQTASSPVVERIPAATIQHIEITRGDGEFVLDLIDGTWILKSEPERPMDPSKMAKVTYALGTLTIKRLIEKNPSDLKPYGLSEPVVTVRASSPTQSETICLGDENPVTGDRYILWSDGTVYTAAADELAKLDVSLSDLTYMESMPSVELDDIRRMTVMDSEGKEILRIDHLEAARKDDFSQSYLWYVSQDGREHAADTEGIETLVRKCLSVELKDCLSYYSDESLLSRYGLDVPQLIVVVETSRGPVLTLMLGKEDSGKLALRFNDCKGIYSTDAVSLMNDLKKDAAEFWPMEWIHIPADDLTGLNLVFSGTAMEMSRSEDQWYLNGSEMENTDFNALYAALSALAPQGWTEREVPDNAVSALSVRLTREGQTMLVRFLEYDIGFYAAEIQGQTELLFSRRDVDAFRTTAMDTFLKTVEKYQEEEP